MTDASAGVAAPDRRVRARRLSDWQIFRTFTVAAIRRDTADRLLGPMWWLIDPLLIIMVYAVVFGMILQIDRGGGQRAYPLFLATAVIPFRQWFGHSTQHASNSINRNSGLLTSVALSHNAIILSEQAGAYFTGIVGGLPILIAFMVIYERPVSWNLILIPIPVAVLVVLGVGVSYLLASFTTLIPDVQKAWAATVRVLFFLSPCLFTIERVPESVRGLYVAINPMAGIIEGIRRPIYEGAAPLWGPLVWSVLWAAALFAGGWYVFKRLDPKLVRTL